MFIYVFKNYSLFFFYTYTTYNSFTISSNTYFEVGKVSTY